MKKYKLSKKKNLHVKDDKGGEEYQELEIPIPTSAWGREELETKRRIKILMIHYADRCIDTQK